MFSLLALFVLLAGGQIEQAELESLARLLMAAQTALPAVFMAGFLAATLSARRAVRRAVEDVEAGKTGRAIGFRRALRAQHISIMGPGLAIFLFFLATLGPFLYVREFGTDPLRSFIDFQILLFVVGWVFASVYVFAVAPQVEEAEEQEEGG